MQLRATAPGWGLRATLALVLVCGAVLPAAAQPRKGPASEKATEKPDKKKDKESKVKNFNFDALDLNGRNRTPQLLYFLERANEELERSTLEKRSFIPAMVRSVDEEAL